MQKFTPYEYSLMAISNANGLDKSIWDVRLDWAENFIKLPLNEQMDFAKIECKHEPILMAKAINAHHDILNGRPTGFMTNLDATASGIQIMSAITGCHKSGIKVNLIDNGLRNELYGDMQDEMFTSHGFQTTRDKMKDAIMTAFYGSSAQPKKLFGRGTAEYHAFINSLATGLPGAYQLLNDIQNLQNPNALAYEWVLPDNHTAYIPVMENVDKKVEIAELNKATFTFRTKVNTMLDFDLSLPANIIHSIDAYIVRQLYRRAAKMGYEIGTIHDSFWAHVNYIEDVRITYADELAKLAESNIIENILNQISGFKGTYNKSSNDLGNFIRNSNYALS